MFRNKLSYLLKKYPNENWHWLSENPGLTIKFIEENKDKLNWQYLSANICLTIEFMETYKNRLDWHGLLRNRFNFHPAIYERNKKIYARKLKDEILQQIEKMAVKKNKDNFNDCIHQINIRIRDLRNGTRNKMIEI